MWSIEAGADAALHDCVSVVSGLLENLFCSFRPDIAELFLYFSAGIYRGFSVHLIVIRGSKQEMRRETFLVRFLIVAALIQSAVVADKVWATDWAIIKPAITTESELLSTFGNPTEVRASFPWEEWSAKWKKRPKADSYILRYRRQESRSQLLVGPGGPADDVEVGIYNGKVLSVTWRYGGPSARSAIETLGGDTQLSKGPLESTYRIGKHMPHGFLSGTLASNGTQAEMRYELK
jgi:hypothetical protein